MVVVEAAPAVLTQLAALCGHDGGRSVVLAGDQLDVVFLAGVLGLDGGKQLGIGLFNQDVAVVHGSLLRKKKPWQVLQTSAVKGCPGERLKTGGKPTLLRTPQWLVTLPPRPRQVRLDVGPYRQLCTPVV